MNNFEAVSTGASIDVGTNSVKLLVAEAGKNEVRRVEERVITTRLGEGMPAQGRRLREASIRRTLDAINQLVKVAVDHGAVDIVAVATAAVREAENQSEFLRRVIDECGLKMEVISGEEEARLSFLAVRCDSHWRSASRLVVIDIGGGSTELIDGMPDSDLILGRTSVKIGAVRVTEEYLTSDPPTIAQLASANRAAVEQLMAFQPSGLPFLAVGVGGTITTLGSMALQLKRSDASLHGYRLTADQLGQEIERLSAATIEQRKQIPGLDPARADIILGGAIVLAHALERLKCTDISVSTRGLRWGVFYDHFLRTKSV